MTLLPESFYDAYERETARRAHGSALEDQLATMHELSRDRIERTLREAIAAATILGPQVSGKLPIDVRMTHPQSSHRTGTNVEMRRSRLFGKKIAVERPVFERSTEQNTDGWTITSTMTPFEKQLRGLALLEDGTISLYGTRYTPAFGQDPLKILKTDDWDSRKLLTAEHPNPNAVLHMAQLYPGVAPHSGENILYPKAEIIAQGIMPNLARIAMAGEVEI